MSGRKGATHYPESVKAFIIEAYRNGTPVRELSRTYGISRYAIQSWCGLRPEVNERRKDKPAVSSSKRMVYANDYERLKAENQLLQDLLQRKANS